MKTKAKRTMKRKAPAANVSVQVGTGNVFKDLGRADAEQAFAKVELAFEINRAIAELGLNQTETAKRLGTDRARVSNLARGQLKEFSIERMFEFLKQLGRDVQVTIRPSGGARGELQVVAKAG